MAPKLCCTAEQENRPDSPNLPNARLRPATPANRPLLLQHVGSPNSCFTSIRSEDLLEIRDLFDHAQDHAKDRPSQEQPPRTRFNRPSMHSLRSLHKMASMRSIIQRKFSKENSRKDLAFPSKYSKPKTKASKLEHITLRMNTRKGHNEQFHINKANLRSHLLSDKKPSKGGYDSDAEMIDDMTKNFGKKMMGKRPSVHSIDWTTSVSSKPTLESSTQACKCLEPHPETQPYRILEHQNSSFSPRFGHVLSTPNLRLGASGEQNPKLRRSYSATSMVLPKPVPISPFMLPSLKSFNNDGLAWPGIIDKNEHHSAALAPLPLVDRYVPETASFATYESNSDEYHSPSQEDATPTPSPRACEKPSAIPVRPAEILSQSMSVSISKLPASGQGSFSEHTHAIKQTRAEEATDDDNETSSLRSVHLHSMRISHHLRSGSLLSWNYFVDAPDPSKPSCLFREHAALKQSLSFLNGRKVARHERHTSSSGFASSKVPSRWGRVLSNESDLRVDFASSTYSSRSQSPTDNFSGSKMNASQVCTSGPTSSISSIGHRKLLTTNGVTPRSMRRYAITSGAAKDSSSEIDIRPMGLSSLASKSSVTDTKKSKFREEFELSSPKYKSASSSSIIKYLGLKRTSMRSQSETNLHFDSTQIVMDGQFDLLPIPSDRERHQSRSMMSLQAEREALNNTNGAHHIWDRALKAHQEEKMSLFLPKNKDFAVQASPFRERSGSFAIKSGVTRNQDVSGGLETSEELSSMKSFGNHFSKTDPLSLPRSRRDALTIEQALNPGQEIPDAIEKQGDGPKVVGAWGRYPSHTRWDRTSPASKLDCVDARDFALEAAIKFASNKTSSHEEDKVDPIERFNVPPISAAGKRKKRKIGSGRMATSSSMTFGRAFLKNYSKIFKSQSTEFRKHGRGHRSSIASGGILQFPELELLPDVWISNFTGEETAEDPHLDTDLESRYEEIGRDSRLHEEDSMATLRPRQASSVPNLNDLCFHDGTKESDVAQRGARAWSLYYKKCVRAFPHSDFEAKIGFEDLDKCARSSLDGTRIFSHSHTSKHSRNASHLSRDSQASQFSVLPSWASIGEYDGAEESSLASVRRSTIDLISKFKEQELAEHDRVLGLTMLDP